MRRFIVGIFVIAIPALVVVGQTKAPKTVKRAQPPAKLKSDLFYADAFKEGLVGERPADLGAGAVASGATAGSSAPLSGSSASSSSGGAAGSGWSALISPGTIEDNIKSLKQQVDKEVTTLSDFKGKGHKLARRDYTMLALLFGIAAEYEGDVRWKKDAAVARDSFARSAANFKVATDAAFNEAKARKEELGELIGGSAPFGGKTADAKAAWPQVANRAPLMQYLEAAWEPRLKPAISDKGAFNSGGDKILRDAELFAAIGEVLAKEGMADADAAEYKQFCNKLRDGAKQIISAVKQKDFGEASKASSTISKACAECHESYRS
jgi:cytochrome c556